jgi:hypothetical protein
MKIIVFKFDFITAKARQNFDLAMFVPAADT